MEIKFYRKKNGSYPVIDFLEKLPAKENAKIIGCLKSIELLGFETPRVCFRQIKSKLWEIKIRTKLGGYRFFYICLEKKNITLLHAYKKQTQKAPRKEIKIAETRMQEVIENENAYAI